MTHQPSDAPVRITGEQRLHPALRKLGRACIALARWQREQQQRPPEATLGPSTCHEPANCFETITHARRRSTHHLLADSGLRRRLLSRVRAG